MNEEELFLIQLLFHFIAEHHLQDSAVTVIIDFYFAVKAYNSFKRLEDGTGLVVIAGKDYGMGSSRDWAAKGTNLLGIKTVIAESFERIHRSNLGRDRAGAPSHSRLLQLFLSRSNRAFQRFLPL